MNLCQRMARSSCEHDVAMMPHPNVLTLTATAAAVRLASTIYRGLFAEDRQHHFLTESGTPIRNAS